MPSYYIGLSLLSNNAAKASGQRVLLSAEGRRILSRLKNQLSPDKGIPDLSSNESSNIQVEKSGRPYFPGSEVDFNISHSGSLTAVSLVSGGKQRTGCDVELIRTRSNVKAIVENFFSASERDYIFAESPPYTRFFQIWTLKECFLKLRGLSVFDLHKAPSFVAGGQFVFNVAVPSPILFSLYELSNDSGGPSGQRYILAAAIEGNLQLKPEIRMFTQPATPSPPSLFCKIIAEIKAAPSPAETVIPKT